MLLLEQAGEGLFFFFFSFFFFFKRTVPLEPQRSLDGSRNTWQPGGWRGGGEGLSVPQPRGQMGGWEGGKGCPEGNKDPAAGKIKSSLLFQINPFPRWCSEQRSGPCAHWGPLMSLRGWALRRGEGCGAGWLPPPSPATRALACGPSFLPGLRTRRGQGRGPVLLFKVSMARAVLVGGPSSWVSGVFSGSQGRHCGERQRQDQGWRRVGAATEPSGGRRRRGRRRGGRRDGFGSWGVTLDAHRRWGTDARLAWRRGSDR